MDLQLKTKDDSLHLSSSFYYLVDRPIAGELSQAERVMAQRVGHDLIPLFQSQEVNWVIVYAIQLAGHLETSLFLYLGAL